MPTMPSFFLLLLILLAPFTSMRACLGRLLRDHQSQPENQGTAVIHGKQQVFIESNSLKRDQWRTTSGGAAATTKSLKDKKTLIASSKAHENDQEAVMKTVVLSGAVRIQTHVSVSWRIPRNMEKKHKGHPGSMDVLAPSPPHAGYTETSQSMAVLSEEQEHQTIDDQHDDQEGTITMNDSLSTMDYQMPRRGPSIHNK